MNPDQLASMHVPSDPRLSPDGEHVAYVVARPNLADDRYDRRIWVDAGPFTSGPGDTAPRWSPDGTRIAFLRSLDGEPAQVVVIPVDGGESETITEFALGVESLEWMPDGQRLMVGAVTYTEEWSDLEDDERERRPRRLTAVHYRFDGQGWTHDRKRHVWLVDVAGADSPHCLTPGESDETSPAVSPDGKRVAFVSDREAQPGLVSGNDVWELDIGSGELNRVTERGFWTYVSYRVDGVLHLLGNENSRYPVNAYLHRVEEGGSLTVLTRSLDRSSVSLAAGPAAIRWNGDNAVVGFEDSGTFGLVEVAPDGSSQPLVEGQVVVTGFDHRGDRLTHTASTWDNPGELFIDGAQVSQLNNDELTPTEPDHFRVESDGVDVDVWVYLPEGNDSVPLLLNVHGGPASQYGFGFFDEFQVYAGAGYGVVACNPRGSSGRGEDYVEAVKGESWGVVDYADVGAAVEAALERHERLDPERLGVMGGSYGGFMAAWIIGREDRWKSAVVERALLSWNSFSGTSDIGGVFPENYLDASYPDAWDVWWQKGPMALAHNVTTPTLILHSENDFRCPIEQAEQYFMALLRNDTATEFVRFPGEGHELSRSGKPRHRKERFEAILDWHDRYLM